MEDSLIRLQRRVGLFQMLLPLGNSAAGLTIPVNKDPVMDAFICRERFLSVHH